MYTRVSAVVKVYKIHVECERKTVSHPLSLLAISSVKVMKKKDPVYQLTEIYLIFFSSLVYFISLLSKKPYR